MLFKDRLKGCAGGGSVDDCTEVGNPNIEIHTTVYVCMYFLRRLVLLYKKSIRISISISISMFVWKEGWAGGVNLRGAVAWRWPLYDRIVV